MKIYIINGSEVSRLSVAIQVYVAQDARTVSRDLVGIAHGIIDSAGRYGETDIEGLCQRVHYAISGYLYASTTYTIANKNVAGAF